MNTIADLLFNRLVRRSHHYPCPRSVIVVVLIFINLDYTNAFVPQFLSPSKSLLSSQSIPKISYVNGSNNNNNNRNGDSKIFASYNDEWDEEYYDEDDDTTTIDDREVNKPKTKKYFATCIPGLANVLEKELISIGACQVEQSGRSGVFFTSCEDGQEEDESVCLKALLWVRTAHRIMEFISTSEGDDYYRENPIESKDDLSRFIQDTVPIQEILGNGRGGLLSVSVNTIMNGGHLIPKELCHSHFTSLTVKNALVDRVRDMRDDGERPDVDLDDPDVPFVLVLKGKRSNYERRGGYTYGNDDDAYLEVSLYRMLHSGGSLHRRGYRASSSSTMQGEGKIHKAAMKESLAAGLLLESGWDLLVNAAKQDEKPAVLVDPMTGSGTLLIEAGLIASDIAPGLMRMKCYIDRSSGGKGSNDKWNPHEIPPVMRWKGANMDLWKTLLNDCKNRASAGKQWMQGSNDSSPNGKNCFIMGNERNTDAMDLAQYNIINAGMNDFISLDNGDCIDWDLGGGENDLESRDIVPGRTIVVTNPPWGLRLTEDIEDSWKSLKVFFREQCHGAEAWVLSGSKSVTRALRMKKTKSVVLNTADEDLRWIQYHIFPKKVSCEEEESNIVA